jgi:hypothetical protein
MAMDPSNETSEDLEDTVVDKASEEVTRTWKLTEKGLQYVSGESEDKEFERQKT